MSIFNYSAVNPNNRSKHGTIVAVSEHDAILRLSQKELSVKSITDTTYSLENKILKFINPVANKDLVIFTRQFSVMISASVPVVESLTVLLEQTRNLSLKSMIAELAFEVDSGSFLSDSFAKRPKIFSAFFVNIIRSGETSGKLDEVLNYLADEMEKSYDISSKIRGAMIYPIFVITALVGVGIILMVYVIPNLTAILTETGAELPLSTRIVITASEFLQKYLLLVIAFVVAVIFAIRFYSKTYIGHRNLDILKLKMPIFGKLFQYIYLMRFARSLSTLLKGGVTITRSLEIVAKVVNNTIYQELILETLESINDGHPFAEVFDRSDKYMPKMVPQMIAVGERTGKIDIVLDKINDFYSRESANMLDNLSKLMEPIIMVIMGVGVGIMVAAVLLPMYNLASQF
ncbi:type II secretion system F family protein [Candidatus Falkowbacteria bacterium]|nr:type II secretion system F family protein [Candidatus Falkowbacteria bacterium]NCT54367.1 type II secretion system F family protein [Candidatus Falkowbacteria bacterium]